MTTYHSHLHKLTSYTLSVTIRFICSSLIFSRCYPINYLMDTRRERWSYRRTMNLYKRCAKNMYFKVNLYDRQGRQQSLAICEIPAKRSKYDTKVTI